MKNIAPALRRSFLLQVLILAFLTPGLILFPLRVNANPYGQDVVAGNVNFQGLGTSQLDINNLSNKAIINWQSFSIQSGETTNINQAANAFTLNRVVSGNPTAIFGQLNAAQGGVAVINPNGIVVHSGGSIDVAGMLTLSTLDITNEDFLDGGSNRFQGTSAAGIKNYGTITSANGDVVILANFLQNAGEVNAPRGIVAFGAGGDIIVDQAGGAKISVQAGGSGNGVGIENSGNINAAAAELIANGNVYALAIKNDGVVRASGYNFSGGRLTLSAGSSGRIINTGTLQARNSDGSGGRVSLTGGRIDLDAGVIDAAGNPGQIGGNVSIAGSGVNVGAGATVTALGSVGGTVSISSTGLTSVNGNVAASGNSAAGGRVTVEGAEVAIGSQARVDVSGQTGGGTAMIGGGFQGKDATVANANNLTVDSGAVIIADAVGSGKGGNVILWSNGDTLFAGELSARGINGGGFAEISGKSTLDVVGKVDLTTQAGAGGTLLLDPTDIVISAVGANALGGSTISNVFISNLLDAGTNVVISTNTGGPTQAGNITVGRLDTSAIAAADQIEWYQDSALIPGGTLSLLAMGDIRFNSSVHSAGAGGVNVVAGWDGFTGLTLGNFDMAAVLATMNDGNSANDAAGLYNAVNVSFGSVQVGGTGTQTLVDVGSRWGATQVAGHDLFLTGSIQRAYSGAQIGFMDNGVEYQLSRVQNGLVMNEWWGNAAGNVTGKDYIALLGGTEFGTGDTGLLGLNAFRGAGWGATGDINVGMSGRLQTRGGTTGSYTQIGHGGILADGAETKWLTGEAARVTRDGISISPEVSRRSIFASTWRTNYAGDLARIDADITVKVDGDIVLMGSRDFDIADDQSTSVNQDIYSMIGHGGGENRSSTHGNITVIADGTTPAGFLRGPEGLGIQLIGGRGTRSFVQIGHGSGYEGNPRSVWDQTRSGDVVVTATTGGIRLLGHNQAIREGDINSGAIIPEGTPTTLNNASDAANLGSHVQIGHGGAQSDFPGAGGIFIMPGGTNVTNITPDSSMTGDITVFAGGTFVDPRNPGANVGIQVQAGNRRWYHAMIGNGGVNFRAENTTDQTPDFGPGAILPVGFLPPTLAKSVGFQGNIRVEAVKGDIVAAGGDSFRPNHGWGFGHDFAMIGNGGVLARGPKGGTITVLAGQGAGAIGGDINFRAGRMNRDFAMIGHGGLDSDSTLTGGWNSLTKTAFTGIDNSAEIIVTARGGISFISPPSGEGDALGLSSDYAYYFFNGSSPAGTPQTGALGYYNNEERFVQLGHGGYASSWVMPDKQNITVTSGTGDMANADGDTRTGGITFVSGDMERDYAQLGHGGHSASGDLTGDIKVTANGGALRFDGSVLGAQGLRRVTDVSLNGVDFAIPVANGLAAPVVVTRGNGGGYEAYVQLGHGGYGARGIHSGDITVNTWGGVDFLAALAAPKVGRTVINAPINAALAAGTNVWVALANLRDGAAPDISSFRYKTPEIYSNIVPGSVRIVLSNGDVITDLPNNSSDDRTSSLILNGGAVIGQINYDNGLVRFQTGGAPGPVAPGQTTEAVATFETAQGLKERSYAQLGHGGNESDGPNNKANDLPSNSGNITIGAAGDINFQGGASHRVYTQLGHGGWEVKGVNSGDITIDHVDANHKIGGIRFTAGYGGYRQFDYQAYAQLGHGGHESDGNMFGNIFVRGTKDAQGVGLLFKAGDRQDSNVKLGHGGFNARSGTGDGALSFGMNGDIDVEVGGTVAFVAGTMTNNNPLYDEDGRLSAQLGHGGYDADPSNNNTSNFSQTRTNPLLPTGTAGAGEGSWGHFGDIKLVTTSGDISFMAGSNIPVANRLDFDGNALPISDPLGLLTSNGAGYGRIHTAQAGHGGYAAGGNHQGNISIIAENGGVNVVGGMLTIEASTQQLHYAQIGHGAANAPGNLGGPDAFIKVHALGGNVVVMGGEARTNSGQIGHGGTHTSTGLQNDVNADISVIARNNLYLNSGNANLDTNWGKIGHGEVRNNGNGTLNGDIHVSVGDTLKMGRALIGHVDYKIDPSAFLRSTRGDTFIAVSRNNPQPGGPGDLITTNQSLITSAGAGTIGEVRLYMPDPSANQIAEGTFISNVDYTRTPAPGSGRADEQRAVEHTFPASNLTEADAQFTPEGPYPFQAFGLYNIYYAGPTPPSTITPPVGGPAFPPGGSTGRPPVFTPFSFNTFFFGDTYDAYDRNGMLMYYDGYDEVLSSIAYRDAMESDADPTNGTWFLEEMLDSRFGSRRYSQIAPGGTVLEGERDEELLRRKRVAARQVGRGALTYYVFDPATNRYSSYRLFGVPQTAISVTE